MPKPALADTATNARPLTEPQFREPATTDFEFELSIPPSEEDTWEDEGVTSTNDDSRGDHQDKTPTRLGPAKQDRNGGPAVKERGPDVVDLVTIAGLAQWADRALRKAGREYVVDLVEVSEQTGRLGPGMKDTLLNLMKLLGDRDEGPTVSAKELVLMLAQLDSMSGTNPTEDHKLLTLLLQDDTEVFSSTRP